MKNLIFLLAIFLVPLASNTSFAQCNAFTKNECKPKLGDYTHNGQYNSVQMSAGESVPLDLLMYSSMDYRIVVCSQEILGNLEWVVRDKKNNTILFNSKDHNNPGNWDFSVEATSKLEVEVMVTPTKKPANGIVPSGCVSVLVGFKERK